MFREIVKDVMELNMRDLGQPRTELIREVAPYNPAHG